MQQLVDISHLERALDLAQAGWWNIEVATGRVTWSDGARRLLGVDPSAPIDLNTARAVLHEKDRDAYLAARERTMRTGEPMHLELRAHGADGSWHWFEVRACANRDAQGVIRDVGGVVQDVTPRKQAELQVRKLHGVLDNTSLDIITVLDPETLEIRYANRGAETLLGYSKDELLGMPAWQLNPDHDELTYRSLLSPLLSGQTTQLTLQGRNQCKSGRILELEVTCEMICPEEGYRAVVKIARDVGERKRLIEELASKNKELESVLYVASHDLRSPLVNINGFSQILQRACQQLRELLQDEEVARPLLEEKIPKAIGFIHSSTEKMHSLIEGLLRMSRTGRAPLNSEVLDVEKLVQRILHQKAFEVQQAQAQIQVAPLPECRGDAKLIEQALSNLIDNALKYRDPERPLSITISGRREEETVVYVVEDTGRGISADHIPRMWEIFGRLDPLGSVAGEGLGLKIARRLIERHGGAIWAESEPGLGTRFMVRLPAGRREKENQ